MQSAPTSRKLASKFLALALVFFGNHIHAQVVISDSCDLAASQAKLAGWSDSRISDKMKFEAANNKTAELSKLKDGYGVMSKEKFRDALGYSAIDTGFYLCAAKNELAARANGSSTSSNTASSSASQPQQAATQPSTTSNQISQSSSGNITAECNQADSQLYSKAVADSKLAATKGDMTELLRISLLRQVASRNLYSGRCSGAENATSRRELAQRGINAWQNYCQQWGMGSQCAAPPVLTQTQPVTPSASSPPSASVENGSSGGGSTYQATTSSDVRPAGDCLSAVRRSSGGIDLQNNCAYSVEAGWCVVGFDCKNDGDWGYSNQWTIGAGRSYPISGSLNRYVNFAACAPSQTSVISTSRTEYTCRK